jgi:hypothetical protein
MFVWNIPFGVSITNIHIKIHSHTQQSYLTLPAPALNVGYHHKNAKITENYSYLAFLKLLNFTNSYTVF